MAVSMANTPQYLWQCVSGDTKPTDSRVKLNDLLFQTDTQTYFIYNGTSWTQATTAPPMRAWP